jgi:hypothetical protein
MLWTDENWAWDNRTTTDPNTTDGGHGVAGRAGVAVCQVLK